MKNSWIKKNWIKNLPEGIAFGDCLSSQSRTKSWNFSASIWIWTLWSTRNSELYNQKIKEINKLIVWKLLYRSFPWCFWRKKKKILKDESEDLWKFSQIRETVFLFVCLVVKMWSNSSWIVITKFVNLNCGYKVWKEKVCNGYIQLNSIGACTAIFNFSIGYGVLIMYWARVVWLFVNRSYYSNPTYILTPPAFSVDEITQTCFILLFSFPKNPKFLFSMLKVDIIEII